MKLGQRICILGRSSSGKSTLAHKIGEIKSIPVHHLDTYHHQDGSWTARPKEEFIKLHDAAILDEQWVMEGNYSRSMPQRFERADTIIKIEMGKCGCLWRYLKRSLLFELKVGTRYGVSKNISSDFSWHMVKWILIPHKIDATYPEKQEIQKAALDKHKDKIIILKSFKEMNALLDSLRET